MNFKNINIITGINGIGKSQLIDIETQKIKSNDGEVIVFDKPENNLFPTLIGEWVTKFYKDYQNGVYQGKKIFIETHSDYIIYFFRLAIKEKKLSINDVSIHHLHNESVIDNNIEQSNKKITEICLTDRGKIYQRDGNGEMLNFVPRGFCDTFHFLMCKLF